MGMKVMQLDKNKQNEPLIIFIAEKALAFLA